MGILSLILSLRASATLTIATARGWTRRAGYPPPIPCQVLLPLLLAVGGLVPEPMCARADSVFLFSQTVTETTDITWNVYDRRSRNSCGSQPNV